jgi:hypothetical protein
MTTNSTLCFGEGDKTEFRCAGDWLMLALWVIPHAFCVLFSRWLFGIECFRPCCGSSRDISKTYSKWDATWGQKLKKMQEDARLEEKFLQPLELALESGEIGH